MVDRINQLPEKVRKLYGSKPLAKELTIQGERINHKRIARIRREHGIKSEVRKRKHPKQYYQTNYENRRNVPDNTLNRNFKSEIPKKKLVSDMTCFDVREGRIYMNAILDLFNDELVAHQFSWHADEKLAIDTLKKVGLSDIKECLFHTDQGTPYIGMHFRQLLAEHGITQSMSRSGNCWDNACMEHFFGTLKCETIYIADRKSLPSAAELVAVINEHIEFYNNVRIKKKLGWLSPVNYRKSVA